ncbi:uncharacterized protein LOC143292662 [Babylonia areolata]|uniref:uncharacterized protein LOC143292662 n=1 Tax=Babylonia areolata TaxID=304850 RepID=UPI003FCF506B
MADLSLDEIIATKQGGNAKARPFNQNVRKQFQGKPVQQRLQQKIFKPGFVTKVNRPGGAPLKRAFSAPGPAVKNASPAKPRGALTPNIKAGIKGPGKGQVDARDMISIKNRIKMGDARLKIVQKQMNKGNMGGPPQPQIPPPGPSGPQGRGPGGQQPFAPQQQAGFQPPPQPFRLPGPQRFQLPNQQGAPFQQPQNLELPGPGMNQARPPFPNPQQAPPFSQQQGPPFNQQQGGPVFRPQQRPPFNQNQRPPFKQHQRPPFNQNQRPPFNQKQQRPPFNQQRRPPFNQNQRPPFNQNQGPTFSQNQGPPFSQNQGPPFSQNQGQNQGPPFNQQQGPPFSQNQGPPFNQQGPPLNQPPQQFNQQPPEFDQQPVDFDQQPSNFMQDQCGPFDQMPSQFGEEQLPPFGQEEPLQFNPDPQFDQQFVDFNPEGLPDEGQQFDLQGPPDHQFMPPDAQFGQPPPPQMNQPAPNFAPPPPGPNQPPDFNQPLLNQGFNAPANLNQPPPEFMQPPSNMSQPPPGFGQMPPGFNEPPPGFQLGAEEYGEDVIGMMPVNPAEKTVVEHTGNSLKITRSIPEVSFDGENLTVTRRVPATNMNLDAQKPFGDSGAGMENFSISRPAPPQPPKKKFQPIPIKAPSPPRNTVKTGGPTLSGNRTRVSSAGQVPAAARPPSQPPNNKPGPGRPVPSTSVQTVTNTRFSLRTAKPEVAASAPGPITRTFNNNVPQQPPRLKPPPQTVTAGPPPTERPSALSRIQQQNPGMRSAFSRIEQPPQNPRSAASARAPPQVQAGSVLSRLSSPNVSVTRRLAPHPASAPPQPSRVSQVSTSEARMAVKRPALSLSERFASGSSGNPIPVITDQAPLKKRRSESELEKANFGSDFAMQGQFESPQEPVVPLLSPLQGYRILVSNLHSTVTQDDIIELFGVLGPLKRANLLTKGQAEVAFIHKEHAVQALKTYHNRELDGQPMFVKLATPLNAKVMQPPPGEDSTPVSLPANLRSKKPPAPSSAPVEIPLIHKALFKTASDGSAPSKAVRFTVKL